MQNDIYSEIYILKKLSRNRGFTDVFVAQSELIYIDYYLIFLNYLPYNSLLLFNKIIVYGNRGIKAKNFVIIYKLFNLIYLLDA